MHSKNFYVGSVILLLLLLARSPVAGSSTSISLQWAICDISPVTVFRKLFNEALPPIPHKIQNITYYDLFPPVYTVQGLAFRTKIHKHEPVSLVKVRTSTVNREVPEAARCRWDRYGNNTWYTCGLLAPRGNDLPLWSSAQVSFATDYLPTVRMAELVPYGPFVNPKWKFELLDWTVVFDSVEAVIDNTILHIMEIEVTIKDQDEDVVEDAHRSITHRLEEAGVEVCDPQLPKTLRVFEALAKSQKGEKHASESFVSGVQQPFQLFS